MRFVRARLVRPQQRADQDHRGSGRADGARDQRADPEQRGIDERCAAEIAGNEDSAGHDIEREQEQDEVQVIGEHRVHECGCRGRQPVEEGERAERNDAPAERDFAVMPVPDMREEQRSGRDAKEQRGERHRPWPAHRGAIERGGVCAAGSGENEKQRGGREAGHSPRLTSAVAVDNRGAMPRLVNFTPSPRPGDIRHKGSRGPAGTGYSQVREFSAAPLTCPKRDPDIVVGVGKLGRPGGRVGFRVLLAALLIGLCGCAHVTNLPLNQPVSDIHAGLGSSSLLRETAVGNDDLLIGLAFSGGGMRAAAFSFGVLKELARAEISLRGRRVALIDQIDFVTGVSGGAVPAAYFGLKRRAALADFRERFLILDAEEGLRTTVSLGNISRAISGGVNEDTRFRTWLDEHLFEGATFAQLLTERRPRIWINATDIYNGTPFVFGKTAFSAICSDLANYPIANAVAASAAVPLVFAPVVLEAYPDQCNPPLPDWIEKARNDPNASPLLRAYALGVG